MIFKMSKQIEINAPAEKVWRIIAHEFDKMSRWSSDLHDTWAKKEGVAPEGAPVCGRVCYTHGFGGGEVEEVFTYYNEQEMQYGYKGTVLPKYINSAGNNWRVRSLGAERSVADFMAEVDLNPVLGVLVKPYLRIVGSRALEELKYYAEQDKPHPRKIKAMQKRVKQ